MNQQTITNAVFNCDAGCIPAALVNQHLQYEQNSMPILAMWIYSYDNLPVDKRDQFITDLCQKGLDLNAQYTINCVKTDLCSYTVHNALSQAIHPDACGLSYRYNQDCIKALLSVGADPNSQYGFIAGDSVAPVKKGSVLMTAVREGHLSAASLLLEHGARFDPATDEAPLAEACVRAHDTQTLLCFFALHFKQGQITLRDVQATDAGTQKTALQIYAKGATRFEGDLDILVQQFELNPGLGGEHNAICIAQAMEDSSRRLQMYDAIRKHKRMASELEALKW